MIIVGGVMQGATYQDQINYVTSGLVQNWDARSYPGSGIAWPATVGNSATLYNSPTYNAGSPTYFNFNNNNEQYGMAPSIGDLTTWTIEAWFNPSIDLSSLGSLALTAVVTTAYNIPEQPNVNYINYCLTNYDGSGGTVNGISVGFYNGLVPGGGWHLNTPLPTTPGHWYQVVGTYDGSNMIQYNNGVYSNSVTATGPSTANGGDLLIGRRWDGALNTIWEFPGDIAIVRIYNTALTSDQVTQNFNAERGRFGL